MANRAVRAVARWGWQPVKWARDKIWWSSYAPARRRTIEKFRGAEFVGLQIGCGTHHKDAWINTDLLGNKQMDFPLDITRTLPFEDNYLSAIYASEVIEHIPLATVPGFLAEARRVLMPGGVIRLTTPDVEALARIYLGLHDKADIDLYRRHWITPGAPFSRDVWINAAFRDYGHCYLYSFESLAELATQAGFSKVERTEVQETKSHLPQLANNEQHYGPGAPVELYSQTLFLEATK